jgi:hypothetical protein
MRIETILNNCQKFKCFVYKNARWSTNSEQLSLDVYLVPRTNSAAYVLIAINELAFTIRQT